MGDGLMARPGPSRTWWRLCMALHLLPLVCVECQLEGTIDPASYLKPQVNSPTYHVQDIWAQHKHLPNYNEINQAAADTFEHLPREFDRAHKNPCWEVGDEFKCLPYFQILGVSKCGTTDLYHRLTFHPDMVDCGWKGPHFWDEAAYPARPKAPGKYDGSFPAYVTIFDKPAKRIRHHATRITGEASSNTFSAVYSHLRGRSLYKRINATLAEYLWEATPWARYIVLFRDPVSRYQSAYHYYRSKRDGPGSPQEFHDRAMLDVGRWKQCLEKSDFMYCLKLYEPQQLVKGMYGAYVSPWLAVFPRSQLLFMRNEDYQAAPREHVEAAMTFLGMRPLSQDEWAGLVGMQRRNSQAGKYKDMLPETLTLLQDFYRPFNQNLSRQFGDDPRWLWGY